LFFLQALIPTAGGYKPISFTLLVFSKLPFLFTDLKTAVEGGKAEGTRYENRGQQPIANS
jgi:hypothetical protein